MSPFKEPQPRKKSIQEEHEAKQHWPPYARLGHEARWPALSGEKETGKLPDADPGSVWEPEPQLAMNRSEFAQELRTAREEGRGEARAESADFEVRKAALEAACALYAGQTDFDSFWPNIEVFETYLRDGTKP